jgi:hypothetical protein
MKKKSNQTSILIMRIQNKNNVICNTTLSCSYTPVIVQCCKHKVHGIVGCSDVIFQIIPRQAPIERTL